MEPKPYVVRSYWMPVGDANRDGFDTLEKAEAEFASVSQHRDCLSAELWGPNDQLIKEYDSGKKALPEPWLED